MNLEEEKKLVEESKQNLAAFEQLYQFYLPKIYGFVFARVLDKTVAEDITSQVFLSSVEKIHTFQYKKDARYSSWLYKVALTKVADHFRNKHTLDLEKIEEMIHSHDSTEKEVSIAFARVRILTILLEIKPRYQEIISLKFFAELNNDEIAASLGLKSSQVAVILHRALGSFREKYIKKYPESEIFDLY